MKLDITENSRFIKTEQNMILNDNFGTDNSTRNERLHGILYKKTAKLLILKNIKIKACHAIPISNYYGAALHSDRKIVCFISEK